MTNDTNNNWFKQHPTTASVVGVFIAMLVIVVNAIGNKGDNKEHSATITIPTATITPKITTKTEPKCHPNYSGCLNPNASDYDCIGGSGNGPYYTGKVRILGPDVFGLDRDGDGWGCQ